MAVPLLPVFDFTSSNSIGLSQSTLSHISSVYVKVTPQTFDAALSFLPANFSRYKYTVDVTALTSNEQITQLLDSGASKVIASIAQIHEAKKGDNPVSDDRLILALSVAKNERMTHEKFMDEIADTSLGLCALETRDLEFVTGWLKEYGVDSRPPVYVSFAKPPTLQQVTDLTALNVTLIIKSELLTVDPVANLPLLSIGEILFSALKSDRPDGLITTLVVDEQNVSLGLVYSSKESLVESLRTGTGVYMSRKRGLWYKGATSGATQELVKVDMDCDADCLRFTVKQKGKGFCHMQIMSCFGAVGGLTALQRTLQSRLESAPKGSYTARLFSDPALLRSKIMEEAEELCDAKTKDEVAFEAADLIYFALTKCVSAGVTLTDIEKSLDAKGLKVVRRTGDAKPKWVETDTVKLDEKKAVIQADSSIPPKETVQTEGRIEMRRYDTTSMSTASLEIILQRPSQKSTDTIMGIVQPIIAAVRKDGDAALLAYTQKFEHCPTLKNTVLSAPFPENLMQLTPAVKAAIDLSYNNIYTFHAAQKEEKPLSVETMPGVRCSRFARPIERVGLYIPGGTAVLPSTALMLGVPALVAGCKTIVLASPPRSDGSITPEIVYIAHKVGASAIVLAGGAQAVAALAYGTESVPKVDKILGPGNQFVTAAKMFVSNDTSAGVSIDMPAGPSEVLVVADRTANPAFVASDLLSQAEHGVDSQVVCIAVDLDAAQLQAIEDELHKQAMALPRVDIVRGAIEHSVTLCVSTMERAFELSNMYAPEHLILQIENAKAWVDKVENAGSVFIGEWTPESVGDYSAGVNHSLPTYGYAKQYSGVNLATFVKHITSSELTTAGLRGLGDAVMSLAEVEGLHAHGNAVKIRLDHMKKHGI